MKLSDFDYNLPKELVAQEPAKPRDHSRLMVLDKKTGQISHCHFYDLPDFLKQDDILVANVSKVFPARLIGHKATGGKVEILLHKQLNKNQWEAMGRNIRAGDVIKFDSSSLEAQILSKEEELVQAEFNLPGEPFFGEVDKIGLTPLPPYIKRGQKNTRDLENYQTVYAKDRGSVAAPTAGLHFTDELLEKVKGKGVTIKEVTLHVGLGTFAPVKTDNVLEHKMHSEYYSVEKSTFEFLKEAKKKGRRIIAVGTTTTRVLEHAFAHPNSLSGWTNIFIYPGYQFGCIDGLITNFHLPKSTLLMLVSALAGKDKIDRAYEEAVAQKYHFFSYGDAMLIL